jgi:hypothetical protein
MSSDGKISATYNLASHSKLIERDFFQIAIFKQSSGGSRVVGWFGAIALFSGYRQSLPKTFKS